MRAKLTPVLSFLICIFFYSHSKAQVEGFAVSEKVDIFYQVFGEGDPLVLINGGPGFPSNHFVTLAQQLAKNNRQTIIFDQRGTGRSEMDDLNSQSITMDLMIQDMEALRKHLGIEQWTLMGHSFGGIYAMSYAAVHPEKVKGIVLSHAGGIDMDFLDVFPANLRNKLSPTERDSLDYWSNMSNIEKNPDYALMGRTKAIAPAYVYHRKHIPKVIETMTKVSTFNSKINNLVWQDLRRNNYNLRAELSDFYKPVLIVGGYQDLVGVATSYETHMALPNSELRLINRCGHYGWLDQPDRYFNIVEEFLGGLRLQKKVSN